MAWDLYNADLSDAAKGYLSVLGSHGDEARARKECEVSEAEVARWARNDVFIDHRRQALAHYEGWKDWKPATPEQESGGQRFIPLESAPPRPRLFGSTDYGLEPAPPLRGMGDE